MSESIYKRIDRAVYRTERTIVVVSLLVMAIIVFLDVTHRSFAGDDSKFAMVAAKVIRWFGPEMEEGTPAYQSLADASPWVLTIVFTWLAYFGIRSTKRETPIAVPIALGGAVVGVAVTYGAIKVLLLMMPNGLVWSQPLALILTLWVGFVGASMCTYEGRHLRVEAVQRFLPEKVRPIVGFLSGLLTAIVCITLMWVSLRYVLAHYDDFVATAGKGGVVDGLGTPKYMGFLALPVAFAFMAIRFSVKAVAAARGEYDEPIEAAPSLPPEALGDVAAPEVDELGMLPSEIPTEAFPLRPQTQDGSGAEAGARTIDRPRLGEGPKPPSAVQTDAHDIAWPLNEPDGAPDDSTRDIEGGPVPHDETRDLSDEDKDKETPQ